MESEDQKLCFFCPVCYERYNQKDKLVPRLLPCTHSICTRCVQQLRGDSGTLRYPECRAPAFGNIPENRYITAFLRKRKAEDDLGEMCEMVNCPRKNNATLRCDTCRIFICTHCFITSHKGHEVLLLEDHLRKAKKRHLEKTAELVLSDLNSFGTRLSKFSDELEPNKTAQLQLIQDRKKHAQQKFQQRADEVSEMAKTQKERVQGNLTKVERLRIEICEAKEDGGTKAMTVVYTCETFSTLFFNVCF